MELSDNENDTNETVDEILSSVLKTKSILRGRMLYGPANKWSTHKSRTDPVFRNYQSSKCTPDRKEDSTFLRMSSNLFKQTPNAISIHSNFSSLSKSTAKMMRSVSTPEIDKKFLTTLPTSKSKAKRKVEYHNVNSLSAENDSLSSSDRNENCNENFDLVPISKENDELTRSTSLSCLLDRTNQLLKEVSNIKYPAETPNEERKGNKHLDCHKDDKLSSSSNEAAAVKFSSMNIKRNLESCHQNKYLPKCQSQENRSSLQKENNPQQRASESKPKITSSSAPHSPSIKLSNSDIIMVNGFSYLKVKKIGKGGSSVVYEVLDLQTKRNKAIKIVFLEEEDEATRNSYRNEIKILQRLQYSPKIIKLYDHEEVHGGELKIVMEVGEIDLAKILSDAWVKKTRIQSYSIKHYWHEMLLAVQVIHKEGIIHSDLKPANFLLVKGTLKLIDFGIASSVQQDMTSVLKDSQSGTYNYMSPESLNDIYAGPIIQCKKEKPVIKISVKSDVWSLGCILYNLVYSKTPFQHLVNPLQKLAAISSSKTTIDFPPVSDKYLLDVMRSCLQFNAYERPSIDDLLKHPYLKGDLIASREGPRIPSPLKSSSGVLKT